MKKLFRIRMFLRLCLLCVCVCFLFLQSAYSQILSFKNKKLETVFRQIEKKTDWTFNYDPEMIAGYSFTGKIDLAESDIFLKKILYETPLEFETVRESVLIVLPEKKEYRLCGYVIDETDKTMLLPFANVYLEGTSTGTTTDSEGHFELNFKAHKNQEVAFSYVGYSPRTHKLNTWKSGECNKIFLRKASQTLGVNITVTDKIIRSISAGKNMTRFDYRQLREKSAYEEYDVLKTIQHLPGITSINESATHLNIRGSTPDQNLVLWEGVRLYDPGHFFGMISAINPFVVNKVDVYKDSYTPHFGNAIGGVVDISLDEGIYHSIPGGVGSSLTEAHAHMNVPIVKQKLSLIASGRHSIDEIWNTPTLNNYAKKVFQLSLKDEEDDEDEGEDGDIDEASDFNFYDLNFKTIWDIRNTVRLKSSYFQSINDISLDALFSEEGIGVEEEMFFDSKAWSTRIQFDASRQCTELYYTLSSYRNKYSFEYRDEEDEEGVEDTESSDNGITDHQFGIFHSLEINDHLSVRADYNYENKRVSYSLNESSFFGEEYDETNNLRGNFHNIITSIFYKKEALELEAHTRNTYYSELKRPFFSPRLTIQYKLRPTVKLRFSTGRFYQFISQIEDFRDNEAVIKNHFWVLHDEVADKVLRSDKVAIGGTLTKGKWLLDAEAYWRNSRGIFGVPVIFDSENFEQTGTSQATGLDVLLYRDWTHYGVWANYSLAKHTMFFSDIQEDRFPANNDHRHSLSLTGSLNFRKWHGTLTWKYRSGLPFSTPEERLNSYQDDEDEDETLYEFNYTRLNDQRQNSYSSIDAALTYRTIFRIKRTPLKPLKQLRLEARLAFTNILNTDNRAPRDFYLAERDDDSNETPRILSIERRLLERTPQFMLRLYW